MQRGHRDGVQGPILGRLHRMAEQQLGLLLEQHPPLVVPLLIESTKDRRLLSGQRTQRVDRIGSGANDPLQFGWR